MASTVSLAALVLILAVGCGGGDGAGTTKAAFLDGANAISADAHGELLEISGAFTGDTPLDQVAAFLHDVYVPRLRTELEDVRALDFPDDDQDELEAMFGDYADVLDGIEADPDQFAASGLDPFADVDSRLDAYGLPSCGSGAS